MILHLALTTSLVVPSNLPLGKMTMLQVDDPASAISTVCKLLIVLPTSPSRSVENWEYLPQTGC